MINARVLALSIAWVVMASSGITAQDLSRYRDFRLGTSPATVAQQAGITTKTRVLHQRPELIEELIWSPQRSLDSSPSADSARKVLFSFYNGQLFRIVVNYEWDRTEGMTVEDMVEALSATYGVALLPRTEISPSLFTTQTDSDKVVAHWEDPEHSLDLFRPSYASTFGLSIFSRRLDALARAASVESIPLSNEVAPALAIDRKRAQEDEDHARQEKARTVNKSTFQP
jgi:hypothetical protein